MSDAGREEEGRERGREDKKGREREMDREDVRCEEKE